VSIRHDYKPAAPGQHRQSARLHGLLVITLVLIGLFGGLLAYIKGDRTRPAPATATLVPTAPPPKAAASPVVEPTPAKPKYDFYTELPKRQIDIRRETVNPRNAPQPSPTRTQPVAEPLRKTAAPRKNTASNTPNSKTPDAKSPAPKTPEARTANAKPTNSKQVNPEPANSKSTVSKTTEAKTTNPKTANSKTADAKIVPVTTPARTAQPTRPLATPGSNIAVKIE